MSPLQPGLFAAPTPEGFRHAPDLLTAADEITLAERLSALPLQAFAFHGFEGKRRVTSFGWRYDFNTASFERTSPIPDWLEPLRDAAAAFAGLEAEALEHALVTEYPAGATIGWHKDRPVFADVVGVSLLSRCVFRFRRPREVGWERLSAPLEPRSAYLLRGEARSAWEHSIPPVASRRLSVTFRTLRR